MPGNEIPGSDPTPTSTVEQEPRGVVPLTSARVDTATRDEVNRALRLFGFDSEADGFRLVMKSFARSPGVRDAVRDSLHLAVLDAPDAA